MYVRVVLVEMADGEHGRRPSGQGQETAVNIYTVITLAPISFLSDTMHLEVVCYLVVS